MTVVSVFDINMTPDNIFRVQKYELSTHITGFYVVSCDRIVEMDNAEAYMVGTTEPGYVRVMGTRMRTTF